MLRLSVLELIAELESGGLFASIMNERSWREMHIPPSSPVFWLFIFEMLMWIFAGGLHITAGQWYGKYCGLGYCIGFSSCGEDAAPGWRSWLDGISWSNILSSGAKCWLLANLSPYWCSKSSSMSRSGLSCVAGSESWSASCKSPSGASSSSSIDPSRGFGIFICYLS